MIVTITLNAAIDKRYEIEEVKTGKVNRVKKCWFSPGGKGLNVARTASIAGEKVIASGFAGGMTGALIETLAKESGMETDFIQVKEESRTCINVWDIRKGEQTEFLEPGGAVTEKEAALMNKKYEKLLEKASVITISGSIPKGVSKDCYEKFIKQGKAKGIPVLLDTSGALLEHGILAGPTLIKPNQDEIEQLMNCSITSEKELITFGKKIQEQGIEYVVISLGGAGAILITATDVFQAKMPELAVQNTVGCGDTMLAGFAVGLKNRWEPEKTLQYASAMAGANALRKETGFYIESDFDEIYKKVKIEKVK